VAGKEIDVNGVTIIGLINMPGKAALDASEMLAANFVNFIEQGWSKETNSFDVRPEEEIQKGCLITHNGRIVNPQLKA